MEFVDATAMAEAVRAKEVSPRELVSQAIEKIEAENPRLNAVVSSQFEQAMAEAERLQDRTAPFAGVPILLKDLGQNEKGQLSTSGSRLFKEYRAGRTDYLVERVKGLGFIILGRTNTPEFGFKNISDSSLHGSVNLPADISRNAGGSSGGSAAAVASGMVPLAMASDGGGSIRIPASFNGLIGLKPSRGRLPVGPGSYRGWQGASSQFALTKSVRDTKNLLYHLQTYQVEAPFPLNCLEREEIFAEPKRGLRIAYSLQSPIASPVSQEARQAVIDLLPMLEKLGHELVEVDQPLNGIEVMQSYYLMNSVETAQMFDEIETSFGRSMTLDDMEVMTWAIFQSGQKIPAKLYSKTLQDWDRYSAIMAEFHQTYDLFLTPTVANVAPKHGQFTLSADLENRLRRTQDYSMAAQQDLIWEMFAESLAWTPFTQQANLTGQPSISLPTYQTAEGLPIGVQLTAAKGREDLLLGIAQELENENVLHL